MGQQISSINMDFSSDPFMCQNVMDVLHNYNFLCFKSH